MSASPQIVTVLGERVSLEPTTFTKGEAFLVPFADAYKYPGMTGSEETVLKKLFETLFSGSNPFSLSPSQPQPPCSQKEKDILLKSLQYRFGLLRNELILLRKSQSDSLRLRQVLNQIQALKEYIDFASTTTNCKEMDEDILAETLGDLSDDQINQLLRQFVFFILQGSHPLQAHLGRDPNPKGFVARLSQNPLPNFQGFMKEYRGSKHPVPAPIERVLQATELDLQAMKNDMEAALQSKTKEIIAYVKSVIPEDSSFWENLDQTDLKKLVDRLIETIQTFHADLNQLEAEKADCEKSLIALRNQVQALANEKAALQNRITILEQEKDGLVKSLSGTTSSQEIDAIRAEYDASYEALQDAMFSLQIKYNELQAKCDEKDDEYEVLADILEERNAEVEALKAKQGDLVKLQLTVDSLTAQLADANTKLKECADLQAQVAALKIQIGKQEATITELRQTAGPQTRKIQELTEERNALRSQLEELQEIKSDRDSLQEEVEKIVASLSQDKETVLTLLASVQRDRASYANSDDPILQKIVALATTLRKSNETPTTLGADVGDLLKLVQSELTELNGKIQALTASLQEKEAEIEAARASMERSQEILTTIEAGRKDLEAKEIAFDSDKAFVEEAIRSVEEAKELRALKERLDHTVGSLTELNASLEKNMEALRSRMQAELDEVRGKLTDTTDELTQERRKTKSQEGLLLQQDTLVNTLRSQIQGLEQEKEQLALQFQQQTQESLRRLKEVEEKNLRDCEERLAALRKEEEDKRQQLLTAQGSQKGALDQKMNDLLRRIGVVEGERNAFEAELDVKKGELQLQMSAFESQTKDLQAKLEALEIKLAEAEANLEKATARAIAAEGEVSAMGEDIKVLRGKIASELEEKDKLFTLMYSISNWIVSGGTAPQPVVDPSLKKYQLEPILQTFSDALQKNAKVESPSDAGVKGLNRCYLVFFISYVFSRHFPKLETTDPDASYQRIYMSFFSTVLQKLYTVLEKPIPGKLEKVGSSIPLQHKAKYLMNLLMPLIKGMELVHESGKHGADVMKFFGLDKDQLETLHSLHKILLDTIKEKSISIKTFDTYVDRRTGSAEDDIKNLYLRFLKKPDASETPVILYVKPGEKGLSKYTFASDAEFYGFLESPVDKSTAAAKVSPPLDSQLKTDPVFGFYMLFYLFMFVVRDYLSSVEGEFDKAGCPLPAILKHR